MNQDAIPELLPSGMYARALNAIDQSRENSNFGLTNELSNELVCSVPGNIVGWTHIDERNATLIFSTQSGSSLYLFYHDTNECRFVCSDSEFGCDWGFGECEYIYGEFKSFNACNELHVYFSSNCFYYVVNIDEMLNATRKAAVISCEDCTYFDLFTSVCVPQIKATTQKNAGSSFEGGAVQFSVQLENLEGNQTNWFDLSNVAYVPTENNIGGELSKSSVQLSMTNLDPKYDKINIAVVKTVNGVQTVEKLDTLTYDDTGVTYTYYGQKGELLNLASIVTKPKAYLRGQDLIQKDGRLFLYNLKNEKNLNYQKYANDIQIGWKEYEVSLSQQEKYHYPSLLRGEVYAFGIVWKYCDGTYSKVFHIPANGGGGVAQVAASVVPTQNTSAATDSGYREFGSSDLNTNKQFDRKRNPPNNQDGSSVEAQENATLEDISNIDTNEQDLVDGATAHDNHYKDPCCEEENPQQAQEAFEQDIDDYSNTYQNVSETLAGLGRDFESPPVNQLGNLKDAAQKGYEDAIVNREYEEKTKPKFTFSDSQTTSSGDVNGLTKNEESNSNRCDPWVDGFGKSSTEETPRVTGSGSMQVYESSVQYSDQKDCDGQRMYPEGNVKHHRVPDSSSRPHFKSFTNGVENQYQPENDPYGNTYVRLMGIDVSNIRIPTEDELPKPLCPNSPYKLVYVERTAENKSVFAKGYLTGTFEGEAHGKIYAYPRYGVNSFEHVSRYIATGDGESRFGRQTENDTHVNFHSLDTEAAQPFLPISHIRHELNLRGNGWRYGLYAEGRVPLEDQWAGTKIDQRGARVANNLNHYTSAGGNLIDVLGITYALSDSIITPPDGVDKPLMNRYGTSCVYLNLAQNSDLTPHDTSFVGDVLDHYAPTACSSSYVALVRDIDNQYGSVESLRYADLNIHARDNSTQIEGICGDVFIGRFSKKRTGYVSEKVGNSFNIPAKPGSPPRSRSVCDSPNDKIFEYFGIDHYSTKLPKSGDRWDAKNYAGLHSPGDANSRPAGEAAAIGTSETDYYFPKVVKSLNHTIIESHINPALRETGIGDQTQEGEVYYPALKNLYLDSSAPTAHPWEESFLNRFYCEQRQPSKSQLSKKALIRSFINLIVPALGIAGGTQLEGVLDTTWTVFAAPMLFFLWMLANNTLFNNKKLDELLGIQTCKTDAEGGDLSATKDECIVNFEDNYSRYNWDYSKINNEIPHYAMPSIYNTCDCDDCSLDETNNEIYHSNKQNLDSEVDAYKNFKINSYNELPAHAGKLRKLFKQSGRFYAHTTDGIWALNLSQGAVPNDIGTQLTGGGELIANPILLFEGSQEGFGGTNHPNASINIAEFGYVFVDDVAKKIYRFNGSPQEISGFGMYNFFKEHLDFCGENDCIDEKQGNFYSLGYDPRYSRLLVTKNDSDDCSSFTISGTARSQQGYKWISFHSYIPQGYIWDRNNFYSVKNNQIWKHHVPCDYQSFYGQKYPMMVESSFVKPDLEDFELDSLELKTKVTSCGSCSLDYTRGLDITFDRIGLWNDNMTTGLRQVEIYSDNQGQRNNAFNKIKENYSVIPFEKHGSRWRINKIKDLRIPTCSDNPIMLCDCECDEIGYLDDGIVDCSTQSSQNYGNRRFVGDYLKYRLEFDNFENVELKLLHFDMFDNIKKPQI